MNKAIVGDPMEFLQAKQFYQYCVEKEKPLEQKIFSDLDLNSLHERFDLDHEKKPDYIPTYAVQLASLSKIKSLTPTELIITDGGSPEVLTTLSITKLNEFLSGMITKPTAFTSTTTTATFGGISGTIVVEKEDGTVLGQTTTGTTLTYGETLTVGAKVYAYNMDAAKNKSLRVVATVA